MRKNVMVRLVVPRFFRQGDEITISAIVHNYLPTAKDAHVSMELDGLQVLDGAQQSDQRAQPRGGQGGLARAGARCGSARVLGKALTDEETDAMELTLPVVPFGVKLAMSESGSLAGAGTQRRVAAARLSRRRASRARAS